MSQKSLTSRKENEIKGMVFLCTQTHINVNTIGDGQCGMSQSSSTATHNMPSHNNYAADHSDSKWAVRPFGK